MTRLSVAEAQRNLTDLVERVVQGGEVILLMDEGKPVAKLVAAAPEEGGHLASVQGWLEDDDPFFSAIEEIGEARAQHLPRVISTRNAG
jgi:prevent-host-death family protein